MKKLLIFSFTLLLLTACVKTVPTQDTATYDSATEAYSSFLRSYEPAPPEEEGEQAAVCSLIYLDDDDIPELAVADGEEPWNPVKLYWYNADTQQVEEIGAFSMYGKMFYIERTGYLLPMYYLPAMYGEVLRYHSGECDPYESWSMDEESVPVVNGEAVVVEQYSAVADRWMEEDWGEVFEEGNTWRIEEFPY